MSIKKKKLVLSMIVGLCLLLGPYTLNAQSAEIQQLILDWQKLTELRKILNNMYKGYEIVSKGYSAGKDISEGNFSLHETFS